MIVFSLSLSFYLSFSLPISEITTCDLKLLIKISVVLFFSFLGTRTRQYNFSSQNARRDLELFLVPEISWPEGATNSFHKNFGNRREIVGKSWYLMHAQTNEQKWGYVENFPRKAVLMHKRKNAWTHKRAKKWGKVNCLLFWLMYCKIQEICPKDLNPQFFLFPYILVFFIYMPFLSWLLTLQVNKQCIIFLSLLVYKQGYFSKEKNKKIIAQFVKWNFTSLFCGI